MHRAAYVLGPLARLVGRLDSSGEIDREALVDLFAMAWRNVWRNRRRTQVTVAAMSLALLTTILYSGLLEGYIEGMERSILDLELGDVQVFAGDYRNNPSIYTTIGDPEALLARLDDAGFDATGRLLAFGLAAAEDASAGASFRGLDVARDMRVSDISNQLASGHWLDDDDPKGVVIGRGLARSLALAPGGELLVITQGADGGMAYELYIVRGVLRAISDAIDRTGVFMVDEAFRELMTLPAGVHQIIVRRPDELEIGAALARIESLAVQHDVNSWRQLMPTMASMLDSARSAVIMMGMIIYLAIAILILNAMLMAVFERIRELGVLKALGFSPLALFGLVMIESAIQTVLAALVGVALGIPGILYLAHVGIDLGSLAGASIMGIAIDPIWRAVIRLHIFTTPMLMLAGIVLLAAAYPATKAALLNPIEAMRHR